MTLQLTGAQVWQELGQEIFAVLGMVSASGKARTAGVVYIVHDRKLYIATKKTAWKARHIQNNPHVSITVPIARHVPFMPWIKIPAATITFSGTARVLDASAVSGEVVQALFRGAEQNPDELATAAIVEVEPAGEFVTYGVGISLMQMRFPEKARGRAPIADR